MTDHLPHLRQRAVAVLGEGALVFPLQAASRTSGSSAIRASRRSSARYAKLPLIPLVVTPDGQGTAGLDADHRAPRDALSGAVDPSARPGAGVPLGADRGVRRRVGQQADVPLPLVLRGRPGVGRRAPGAQHDAGAERRRAAERRRHDQGAHDSAPHVRRLGGRRPRSRSRTRTATSSPSSSGTWHRAPICSANGRRSPTSASTRSSISARPIRPRRRSCASRAPHVVQWIQQMLGPRGRRRVRELGHAAPRR